MDCVYIVHFFEVNMEKSETKENDKKSDIDTPEGSDITDN